MATSSYSRSWVYDVFPSFSGEDVRITFLSHFLKELDRKLIIAFKDNEIERSQSLDPMLKQAIRDSRIAVVVFSKKYASSSWCLNELLEIVKCKEEFGQLVIPIFYRLDPSHVRKQTGEFGEIFQETCKNKTEEVKNQWQNALTDVANILGYHSVTWDNEAKMIEEIANDVLDKLLVSSSIDSEDFVGIEDHIAEMSVLLQLETEEVRMVGIWGSSGIGKTSIARVLFNRLSRHFRGSVFIDSGFVSKSTEIYSRANSDDYNMKLDLQRNFLSEILGKKDIQINRLGAVGERLKHQKVLIFIDDLDDHLVLDALVGKTHWFGCGSRIIVVTKDKHFLRAHGIEYIYEVCLPSKELALKMFSQSAFRKNCPPDGFMELASEVALLAGNLPLGLNVLGSYLRGRNKEDWMDMMPGLRNRLNGLIERTLKVSYDGLNNKRDAAIFRHIACLFNGEKVSNIKLLLDASDLDISNGLKNLADKSLIQVREDFVEMHSLLQDMGKEIVRSQSDELGEREFIMDSKDVCDLLEDNIGTKKVLGIALDMDEIDELHIHENAFKGMRNLLFLNIYTKKYDLEKEVRWHLPEGFNYLPHKLRFLRLDGYPMRYMPSSFRPENLVKLQMSGSKLERLWEGVHKLRGLKEIDLQRSRSLKEIPDLSMATNLKRLDLCHCSSLVELPSSIQCLNKLKRLDMTGCKSLETLPTGINLQSLYRFDLEGCTKLKSFPGISTNISYLSLSETRIEEFPCNLRLQNLVNLKMCRMKSEALWERVQPLTPLMTMLSSHSLTRLFLSDIPSLVELPSSIQNFSKLEYFWITECINLETLPTGINLQYLRDLYLTGCSRLKTFPDISTNTSTLYLTRTGIEEVPWWIQKFSMLKYLNMNGCNRLQCVSLHISKLKHLYTVDFSNCGELTEASWSDSSISVMAMETGKKLPVLDEASYSFPGNFIDCFNFDQECLLQRQTIYSKFMRLSGDEVPSYFTHRTTGTSLTNISLLHTSPSQPFVKFKACAVVDPESSLYENFRFDIYVSCRFKGRLGKHFESPDRRSSFGKDEKGIHILVFECWFPLNEDKASQAELNYNHVDIQFRLSNRNGSTSKLKGCGIRLFKDRPLVCESDEENMVNETEHSEESGDSNIETERSRKRMRIT